MACSAILRIGMVVVLVQIGGTAEHASAEGGREINICSDVPELSQAMQQSVARNELDSRLNGVFNVEL